MLTRILPKSCFPTNNTRGLPHLLVRWGHITVGEAAAVVGPHLLVRWGHITVGEAAAVVGGAMQNKQCYE